MVANSPFFKEFWIVKRSDVLKKEIKKTKAWLAKYQSKSKNTVTYRYGLENARKTLEKFKKELKDRFGITSWDE